MANVLKVMGVRKGDVVTIYLPRIPEIFFAMLACAKIGAVHSVFSPTVENVIVVRNTKTEVSMDSTRDHWYDELCKLPIAKGKCETVQVDTEDPLFILYTSGFTGKPKAIVHTHGGYQVGTYITLKQYFDIKEEDRWWCTADPGWINGHSYLVYGPLLNGATVFMHEGGPTYPYPDGWWQLIEHYGITSFYTALTAIRTFMCFGDAWVRKHDLSSLRVLGSVGESINPEAWRWFHDVVGDGTCPITDTWWQTETGMFQITTVPSMPLKPGAVGRPVFGQEAAVVDEEGHELPAGKEGFLVLKNPWPAMMRTLYKDPDRYLEAYWTKYPGVYLTGDSARIDDDGYIWIIGRADDVIKVSGHRIGTAEVESALIFHPAVAEAAAIGLPHEVKRNAIHMVVVLNHSFEPTKNLVSDIRGHVAETLSPIAKPDTIEFVDKLPKTRSGKIVRRVLKARVLGGDEGDLSTLED